MADMEPKRDILGELYKSLEKRNLKTIATFYHARHGQRNANKPETWEVGCDGHCVYHLDFITSTIDSTLLKLYVSFESIDKFNEYWLDQINDAFINHLDI